MDFLSEQHYFQQSVNSAPDEVNDTDGCRLWDPTHARVNICAFPYLASVPLVLAGTFLIFRILAFFCPSPAWTRPFVREQKSQPKHGQSPELARGLAFHGLLIVLCTAAFLAQSVLLCLEFRGAIGEIWMTAASFLTILLIVLDTSRTTSIQLLFLFLVTIITRATLTVDWHHMPTTRELPAICALAFEALALITIFNMPFRDPCLSRDGIARIYDDSTSQLRSPEDDLTLFQFFTFSWMTPLIKTGYKRQLNDPDVWYLGFGFQHEQLHQAFHRLRGSVIRRLIVANAIDLILTTLLGIVELAANFSIPVLLQQLLRAMEEQTAPRSSAVTYAILMLIARLVACQTSAVSLWSCRRCYERSRGEMITMLYEKTLSRKIVGSQGHNEYNEPSGNHQSDLNGDSGSLKKKRETRVSTAKRLWALCKLPFELHRDAIQAVGIQNSASTGKILNLMRTDVYEIAQRFWEFQNLITKPLGLIFSVVLIWRLMGWACLIGVLTVVAAQVINIFIARLLLRWERRRRQITDAKLQAITRFVEAIRHLRWYGWQGSWLERVLEARDKELKLKIITSLWNILISFTNTFSSGMFPVAAFYAYTALSGQKLRIDIAFPALQLFNMLETNLRQIPGLITVLLNATVAMRRVEEFMQEPDKPDYSDSIIEGSQMQLHGATFAWPGMVVPVLHNINLRFDQGLNVIAGEVASGKTALLQAVLGELDILSGVLTKPNSPIAYCNQIPWLESMSIRDNILFHQPYDEVRYKSVLESCALIKDFSSFENGDLSNIGENGIGLSGGQKARVSLARAVYNPARILLLDDPLSALDHQTAEHIVRKCFAGDLLRHRTTILVTHRVELCSAFATQMIVLKEGRARTLTNDEVAEIIRYHGASNTLSTTNDLDYVEPELASAVPAFIETERRAHGGVHFAVYWQYIRAGKLKWWLALIVILALYRTIAVSKSWFLKSWGESYKDESIRTGSTIDIRDWLLGFAAIAAAQALAYLISQLIMLMILYTAGRQMFIDVMAKVAYATFRFYDVTPVGRLMNRLTGDISTIDGNISQQFQNVARLIIAWGFSVMVIASVTPTFLLFSVILVAAFLAIFLRFLPTSQSLRRLEMVSLTPMMSNFGALPEGLLTIRAFCAQQQFRNRIIKATDAFQKMDHFYWTLQMWLMYRLDILSACSTLALTLLALYTNVSPGLTAFVLIAASKFVTSTHALCRQYGQLQMDFVSVERVVELLHLDQENPGDVQPPAWWPSHKSDIVFEDVTVRYAPHLEPSLRSLSFTIKAGSKTAVVGRTGSGKSTLALSLLSSVPVESGRILIGGIDASRVDKQALRSRITFLAQEPVLFPGTMRQNLDPLQDHSDSECEAVLNKVCERFGWSLSTQVDAGGRNFSQGQRQMIGLTRAVLRRSTIVILDEATASIDHQTSLEIQHILQEPDEGKHDYRDRSQARGSWQCAILASP